MLETFAVFVTARSAKGAGSKQSAVPFSLISSALGVTAPHTHSQLYIHIAVSPHAFAADVHVDHDNTLHDTSKQSGVLFSFISAGVGITASHVHPQLYVHIAVSPHAFAADVHTIHIRGEHIGGIHSGAVGISIHILLVAYVVCDVVT